MPIAACSIAWQPTDRWAAEPTVAVPVTTVIAEAAALGVTGLECWEPHVRGVDPAAVRAALATHGLRIPMVSGYYDFTGDPARAAASRAHGLAVVARAQAVGAPALRIFTGKVRGSEATSAQWDQALTHLRAIADAAPDIALVAELHDWNLMDTPATAEQLLTAIDRPNVGLILHPERLAGDEAGGIAQLAPWIRHVHVRTAPDGQLNPEVPWPIVVAALRTCGYTGWWSVEHFAPEPQRAIPRAVAALRALGIA